MTHARTLDDRLQRLIGDWSGNEWIEGRSGQSHAIGHMRYRSGVGGTVLLQDYEQEADDGRIVFRGHGVLVPDPDAADGVLWWWFDGNGMPPRSPASGRWAGDVLEFHRDEPQLRMRHRYAFDGADRCRFTAELRLPGAADFSPHLTADYRHERLGLHR